MTKISQPAVQTAAHTALIKIALFLIMPLWAPAAAFGQALPTAEAAPISTGFALPRTEGALQYAVSASESLSWGYYSNSGVATATNLTGDLAYLSNGKVDPFSIIFSGGRSWSSSSQPSYGFLNLALSQVIKIQRWNFVLSDGVSYLPGTPATGLSGIPGVGDLGVSPVQVGADTGQGVLTNYSTRVSNTASGSAQRELTGKTSLQVSGAYTIARFLGDSSGGGLDSDGESGSIGLNHRIDARSSFGGNYSYSRYTYGALLPGFTSQTASMQYARQLTRKLSMNASAGPQWTSSFNSPLSTPASLSLFADVSAGYAGEFSHASLAYTRGTNSGSGVLAGALSDSVSFAAGRTFARVWNCTFTTAYSRTTSLAVSNNPPFSAHTTIASVQVARALTRSLSAYASYTLENQSNRGTGPAVDLFSGLSKVASFGLTYSPGSIHLGRR